MQRRNSGVKWIVARVRYDTAGRAGYRIPGVLVVGKKNRSEKQAI